MNKRYRKKSKLRWLRKVKSFFLKLVVVQSNTADKLPQKKKRIRKKRRYHSQKSFLEELKQSWFQLFERKKQRRRRSRRKSLSKRIQTSWSRLQQNLVQYVQKLFLAKKRRRRKKKQYAVYVMSNQKKVD